MTRPVDFIDTKQPTGKNKGYYADHAHNLTRQRILGYIDKYGNAKTGPGYKAEPGCYYCSYIGGTRPSWTHEEIIALAAKNKIGFKKVTTIEVEKIVEVERIVEVIVREPYEVKVPFAETLSFGEHGSLIASLQHGQHLLNDDLRAAMLANDPDWIELARARLADHMSLMGKLGVEPADWTDNHNALLRAGRIDLPIEEATIWSRA